MAMGALGAVGAGMAGGAGINIIIRAVDKASGVFASVNKNMLMMGAGIAAVGIAGAAAVGGLIKMAGQFEQTQIAFTTMLGSAGKADKLLKELADFAAKTPFTIPGIEQNAKMLLAMSIPLEDLLPTLKSLGDIASGLNVPMERLALNFGQVRVQGKLTGRELRDFSVAGVPLIAELAKNLNIAESEVKEMVSAGKIGFAEVEEAFKTMTGEGGKFFDLMDAQSKTFLGQVSNIQDSFIKIGRVMGEIFLPAAKWVAKALAAIVGWMEEHPMVTKFAAGVLAIGTALTLVAGSIMIVVALKGALVLLFTSAATAIWGAVTASLAFIATPLGLVCVAIALAIGLVTRGMKKAKDAEKELIRKQEALTEAIKEYEVALENVEIASKRILDIEEQIIDTEKRLAEEIENAGEKILDIKREIIDTENELSDAQDRATNTAYKWTEAIKRAKSVLMGLLIPTTKEEAKLLYELELAKVAVTEAQLSGDEDEINSAKDKVNELQSQWQRDFENKRAVGEAYINYLAAQKSEEEGLNAKAVQFFQTEYSKIPAFLESEWGPAVETSFNDVTKELLNDIQKIIDKLDDLVDKLGELQLEKIEIELAGAEELRKLEEDLKKAKEEKVTAEKGVVKAKEEVIVAETTVADAATKTQEEKKWWQRILQPEWLLKGLPETQVVKRYGEGGLVPQTGLAMVHKGEYVIPVGKGVGGAVVNFYVDNIYGTDPDEIAEALQDKILNKVSMG